MMASALTKDGKVKNLTPRQLGLLYETRDRWLALMRCTDPVDRDAVNSVLHCAFPQLKVGWVESPIQLIRRVFELESAGYSRLKIAPHWLEGTPLGLPSLNRPLTVQLHKPLWKVGVQPQARTLAQSTQAVVFGKVAVGRVISQIEQLMVDVLTPRGWRNGRATSVDGGISQFVSEILTNTERQNIAPEAVNSFVGRAAYCEYMRDVLGAVCPMEASAISFARAAAGCYFYSLPDDRILLCERPRSIMMDDQGRAHGALGPAVEWSDGCGFCAWHGQAIPISAYLPGVLTPEFIHGQTNGDIRASLIDMMGIGKYLDSVGARLVCTDLVEVIKGSGEMMPRAILEYGGAYYLEGCDGSTDRTYFMPIAPPPPMSRFAIDREVSAAINRVTSLGAERARLEAEAVLRVTQEAEKAMSCMVAHQSICGLDEQYCVAQS